MSYILIYHFLWQNFSLPDSESTLFICLCWKHSMWGLKFSFRCCCYDWCVLWMGKWEKSAHSQNILEWNSAGLFKIEKKLLGLEIMNNKYHLTWMKTHTKSMSSAAKRINTYTLKIFISIIIYNIFCLRNIFIFAWLRCCIQ